MTMPQRRPLQTRISKITIEYWSINRESLAMFKTCNANVTTGSAPITLFKAMTSTSGNANHKSFSNGTCTECLYNLYKDCKSNLLQSMSMLIYGSMQGRMLRWKKAPPTPLHDTIHFIVLVRGQGLLERFNHICMCTFVYMCTFYSTVSKTTEKIKKSSV